MNTVQPAKSSARRGLTVVALAVAALAPACSSSSHGAGGAGGGGGAAGAAGAAVGVGGAAGAAGGAGGGAPTVLANVGSISAGYNVTCGALLDGTVRCFGDNGSGRLVVGINELRVNLARPVLGLSGVAAVSVGDRHQCALLTGGTVQCWGQAVSGQLGDGASATMTVAGPVPVTGLADATSIAVGSDFSCALRTGGTVGCWGKNGSAQLGGGVPSTMILLSTVAGIAGARDVAAGWEDACAIVGGTALGGGMVQCWGANIGGAFGDGAPAGSPGPINADGLPAPATGITTATAIAAGRAHNCALLGDGTVSCWGLGTDGQLGDGRGTSSPTPVTVVGLTGPVQALSIGNDHTCALLKTTGTLQCWGKNESGEIGDGTTMDAITAVVVPGLTGVVGVAAGTMHTCALLADHTAACWGDNQYGELGSGTLTASVVPVTVKSP